MMNANKIVSCIWWL